MDLEAVFAMADDIIRPVADPLRFHDTNEEFLGVDFSFFPTTHASVDMKDPTGFSMFDAPTTPGATHVQQRNPSVSIDSDDDFGDFTSVPAETLHAMDASLILDPFGIPANTTFEPDVGNSFDMFGFHTSSSHPQISPAQEDLFGHFPAMVESPADTARNESTASTANPIENNSDDDWGDFVEHSTSAVWTSAPEFDWFNSSQQNVGQGLSEESVASKVKDPAGAWESGIWTGPSKVEGPKSEQSTTNFALNDFSFFDGEKMSSSKDSKASPQEPHVAEGFGFGNEEMSSSKDSKASLQERHVAEGFGFFNEEMAVQQKTSALQRTLSGQKMGKSTLNSLPIPLSLFGETELEVENSNPELPDPTTKPFQGHSRSKARSTGSFPSDGMSLSDLIATLYTESQPNLPIKNPLNIDSVNFNENKGSVNNDRNGKDLFDTTFVNDRTSNVEERMFSLSLSLEHAADPGSLEGTTDMFAESEVQAQEPTCMSLLESTSTADRCTFVKAWASMVAVCASELELALNIWKQAQNKDAHLDLLADLQGKKYFAAIGQVYVVALILATASNFYKPWLRSVSEEAESLQADLQRCKAAWLQTNLKEGVHLALDGLQGSMPRTVLSWKGIEEFTAIALEAYSQAAKASVHPICRMSLLPMASFNYAGLPPVEWLGSSYILPLANMWANCVSHEPPLMSFATQPKTSCEQN